MNVLQIVGYKNSGKTSLSNAIISYFGQRNILVGALKHHGHGGVPIGLENTDSEQHRYSGATIAGVVGEHIFQLSHHTNWDKEILLLIYKQLGIELLVVEGYKQWLDPKIVMVRNESDLSILSGLTNIIAIYAPFHLKLPVEYPVFQNKSELVEWLFMRNIKGKI
ncbi:molybdopterin-guanine dinucleotide biosynthesis protein B [Ornithinibacillus bavariensis]|uniref:Molybdopterin-guanine dinucleotide biosynthesis protein MobB n=1 Tax=Ornithinibacillus bavariensis TaxID=545502 RepID=A0A919X7E4_9BACI|nr:molybdopterin-guanine dinucleotide biosynthesis protein B [Ornithinibacillus bavariensis]GIO25920.1 molybdopterin-guanine dinucleotide biosynthesis protein MobB [Ornithinibacillus bavariensis]